MDERLELGDELEDGSQACFEGDKGDLSPSARRACTALLTKYFISEETEGALFQTVIDNLDDIERCMNNLYLRVKVSKRYRVVYAVSVPEEELVSGAQRYTVKRNAPLKRDETILLVRLRVLQHKLEAEDPENWFVERRDMEEHLTATCYSDDLDEERVALRVSNAIKTLTSYGYIKLINEDEQRYRIMPVLPAILDLQTVLALTRQIMEKVLASDGETEGEDDADAPGCLDASASVGETE